MDTKNPACSSRQTGTSRTSAIYLRLVAIGLAGIAALTLSPSVYAQVVTGEVTDAKKTITFEGAIVSIEGMRVTARTNESGRFRLSNVPAGQHTLIVSYVGTPDTRISINVPESGLAMGEVVIGARTDTELEEVIVVGQSAAVAGALNQERSADNLVSVLDTDAMGQFPDQNVAEALRRLTGVSVENDQGEGRYVVIRGMDPDLNATSINGVRATAAEPRRALQLDIIPSDVLDGLEVNKTLTPDMDGDAIGGSINVRTLSAFRRKGAYIKARAEGSYNEYREEWSPKVSFAGSNIFEMDGDRRFGIAGAISYNDRSLQVDNNEADDWSEADNGADFMEEFEPRMYLVDRERIGGALNFDLDISASTTLHLYTLYSDFKDTEVRYATTYKLDGLDEGTVSNTSADYGEAELERTTKDRDQSADNLSISLGSETQLENWLIAANVGYSAASELTANEVESAWVAEFETDDGIIAAGQPVLSVNRANNQIPLIQSGYTASLNDASLFELDGMESKYEKNDDDQLTLQLDATRATEFGELKFGVKSRIREKTAQDNRGVFSGDGSLFLSDALDADGASAYGFPNTLNPVPNLASVRSIFASGTGLEFEAVDSEIDSNVGDFTYDEDVLAAYGMGKWDTDRLTIIAGVRVEWTDVDNRGNEVELIEEGEIVDGVPLAEDTVFITPVRQTDSYSDVLPSINLRFNFSEDLIGRASLHRAVVRPGVEFVAFRVAIEDNEAELGNPDLKPYRAWNADASISWYPTELSVLSGGIFYKEIEDFVFVQTLDDYAWQDRVFDEAVIAQNGDDATVFGVELTYQQHFGFLGAPFDGFLVAFNYTYVDSDADTGERKINLPKQSENIGSFLIGYDKYGLDLRLAIKYRDKYLDELVEPGLDRFTDEHLQWDFTAKYRFSENWLLYAEFANLGDEPEYYYAGKTSRMYQYDEFGTTSVVGIQYNFQ
ncbi:MAG TPA: TonB-dependent receptor [Woeseiaceae bacterium]|nr:TonB-dependent receptor [Woeseiaceae bacterium]